MAKIVFPGGDDLAFVTWIADNSHRNIACVLDVERRWRSQTIEVEGERATLKELVEKGGISLSYSQSPTEFATGVNIANWPTYVAFDGRLMPRGGPSLWRPKPDADRSGTFRMPRGSYLNLTTVRQALAVEIKAHWFLEHVPFVIAAKSWSSADIIPAVALAIGAKATRKGNSWDLSLNVPVLRARYAGMRRVGERIKVDGGDQLVRSIERASLIYTGAVYASLSDSTVERLYARPDVTVEQAIPSSGVIRDAAQTRAAAMFPESSSDPTTQSNRKVLESGINWDAAVWAYISPRKQVALKLRLRPGAMGDSVFWVF